MNHAFSAGILLLTSLRIEVVSPTSLDFDELRQRAVREINERPGLSWRAGINSRFQGLPLGSAKSLCGVKPGGSERLRKRVAEGNVEFIRMRRVEDLPVAFDSAARWPFCAEVIEDIRDQSDCGCCWAFAAVEAASDRLCIYTNGSIKLPLSSEEGCFCAEINGCGGGTLEKAWDYIQTRGLTTGGQYNNTGPFGSLGLCSAFSLPHCHHHGRKDPFPDVDTPACPKVISSPQCPVDCDSTSKLPYSNFNEYRYRYVGSLQHIAWDADTISEQILKHGPVEAAFIVYKDFEHYLSGIYHATSDEELGEHAVKLVGWGVEHGQKYWKVQNSWNAYWGENGYFRIRRGSNECGIESQVVVSSGASSWIGPGVAPSPPSPVPGNCWEETTQESCESTIQDGERCQWCSFGEGLCVTSDDRCSNLQHQKSSTILVL